MVAQTIDLPNIRKLFIPDPGFMIADADLAGADAQVVAWEANDEELKDAFRKGLKVHAENAKVMFGAKAGSDGLAEPYYKQCKGGVHATNYGGSPYALARNFGWSVAESTAFQRRWFDLHPGIKRWHESVEASLNSSRSVSNKFGYRIYYFDRVEKLLPEALAWVPQSTVANVCTQGAMQLRAAVPWVQILLQVHDSLVFQYPIRYHERREEIKKALQVVVPYDDPLTIPWSLKVSKKSWGHCKSEVW